MSSTVTTYWRRVGCVPWNRNCCRFLLKRFINRRRRGERIFSHGFGGRGGRGGDHDGRGHGGPRSRHETEEEKWVPVTKLGRLVKNGKIRSLEQIHLHSLPIKEFQIIDTLIGPSLKDEVMKIIPVLKQTRAGHRTGFKAFVVVGDRNGHVGLGVKCSKEVATAIRGAFILAKLSVRRGNWGNKIRKPHNVPCRVTRKCGSVTVRVVPHPRGAGTVASRVPRRSFSLLTYGFLTPDFWKEPSFTKSPFQEYFDILAKPANKVIVYATEEAAPERFEA
ncbi:hypothetical protein KY289_032051 [Solanum tuberosum]|nr:hypothetical protein KY289_032051 [Solanum tuberosum]